MKYIFAICLFFCSLNAFANSAFSEAKVSSVVVHDFGTVILVNLDRSATNGEGCTSNTVLVVKKTHPLFNEMYSAVLSAFHSGARVRGWVNGCESAFSAPIMTRFEMFR